MDVIDDIQKKLDGKVPVQMFSPEEQDIFLNNLYQIGIHENLLSHLSDHYGVSYKELRDLLLSRQLLFLHIMTDYSKPADEAVLQTTLGSQQGAMKTLIDGMTKRLGKLDEAIRQTEYLRDQAAQVLAIYKTKYLQDEDSKV